MTQVLVTRPLEASRQLANQLETYGLAPIVMPLYTFSARQTSFDPDAAWYDRSARNLAVFTSPRAVQYGLPHIPQDRISDIEFAVVGSATRARIESAGFSVHLQSSVGFTSEDLLQMPQLLSNPGHAVIFCAPGGREALEKGLGDLGWHVIKAMVYERKPVLPDTEQCEAISSAGALISVWTSVSALELARQGLTEAAWQKVLVSPALVISARIQNHLQTLGGKRVELSGGPGNKDLMHSILQLAQQFNIA